MLLEETDFDTYSVSGPFSLESAIGISRLLAGDAHVVDGESGHRLDVPAQEDDAGTTQ